MDQQKTEAVDHPLWAKLGLDKIPPHRKIVLCVDELWKMAADGTGVKNHGQFVGCSNWILKRYKELSPELRKDGHRYVEGAAGGHSL